MTDARDPNLPNLDTLRLFAEKVYPTLDDRNYYQLLNVPADADAKAVRLAFYKLAAQLHPDRFHTLADATIKDRLETIYARVCEAYRVLGHRERRPAYDKGLAAGQKRLDLVSRETTGSKNPEDGIKHPEAKKFFRMGMVCAGRKDWKGAVLNFTFAKNFEPGTPTIAEKLSEAQTALAATKGGGGK